MRGLSCFVLAIILVFCLALLSHKEEMKKGQEVFKSFSNQTINLEVDNVDYKR